MHTAPIGYSNSDAYKLIGYGNIECIQNAYKAIRCGCKSAYKPGGCGSKDGYKPIGHDSKNTYKAIGYGSDNAYNHTVWQ